MRKRIIPVVILLAAVAAAVYFWNRPDTAREPEVATSGTVEATDALLGFEIGGRLAAVEVEAGDEATAGQVLARLDTAELAAQKRQLEAQIDAARARLAELEAGFRREEIAQAREGVAAAAARMGLAEKEEGRFAELYEGGAVARDALDRARTEAEVTRRELARAREQLALLSQGYRRETVAAQRAQVAQAEAALEALEVRLTKAVLVAPFGGRITVRHREPGEVLAPGTPVLTLLDLDDRWVRIYVPEDRLGAVALGARAAIHSDTWPGKAYAGEVFFIASEAEFTPKSVQTREERVRLVYAVKVRVLADAGQELKPGMPVDVDLELGDEAPGPA